MSPMTSGGAAGGSVPPAGGLRRWQWCVLLAGLFAYCLGIFANAVADPDLWGSLAFGKLLFDGGRFPYHDVFSYVPTKAVWVNHEWLAAVLFYAVWNRLGAAGLQLLRYLTAFATLGLIAVAALKRGARAPAVLIVLFLTAGAITPGYSPVRAQVFTYLFFALSLLILEGSRAGHDPGRLWWLVPLHLAWCNLHGGFVAGLGLIGLYAVGEALGRRAFGPHLKVLLLSGVATLVNPYGVRCWTHVFNAITMPRPGMSEWMSMPEAVRAGHFVGLISLCGALFLLAWLLLARDPERSWTDVLVLGATACLGFVQVRQSILFLVAFGVLTPLPLSGFLDGLKHRVAASDRVPALRKAAEAILALVFVALCGASFTEFATGPSLAVLAPAPEYPVGAIEWIRTRHWRGRILPDFDWGEFLIWTCSATCRVGMDGRLETVYGEKVSREYSEFLNGRSGWRTFLEEYPHDMVLLKPWSRTAALMRERPGWWTAYQDGTCVVFLRRGEGI